MIILTDIRAPLHLRGMTLMPEARVLFKHTQIVVKTKMFTVLIIPNSLFETLTA